MSKPQNRGIRNMKSQGNTTPHKVNNHTTKDLMEVKGMKSQFPRSEE
jgi:hypothetical protein